MTNMALSAALSRRDREAQLRALVHDAQAAVHDTTNAIGNLLNSCSCTRYGSLLTWFSAGAMLECSRSTGAGATNRTGLQLRRSTSRGRPRVGLLNAVDEDAEGSAFRRLTDWRRRKS